MLKHAIYVVFKAKTSATEAERQELPEEEMGCMDVSDDEKRRKKISNLSEICFCVSTKQ